MVLSANFMAGAVHESAVEHNLSSTQVASNNRTEETRKKYYEDKLRVQLRCVESTTAPTWNVWDFLMRAEGFLKLQVSKFFWQRWIALPIIWRTEILKWPGDRMLVSESSIKWNSPLSKQKSSWWSSSSARRKDKKIREN